MVGIEKMSHREWLGGYEAARVIVTTKRMVDELMWLYSIPESKIDIIPNGIVCGKDEEVIGCRKGQGAVRHSSPWPQWFSSAAG